MKNKKNLGFTLIELLIVIAIIGILASAILVGLSGSRERAKDAAVLSSLTSAVGSVLLCLDSTSGTSNAPANNTPICDSGVATTDNWPDLSDNNWTWGGAYTFVRATGAYSFSATSGTKTITCSNTTNGRCTKTNF